jgi:hypothetical protein
MEIVEVVLALLLSVAVISAISRWLPIPLPLLRVAPSTRHAR